MNFLAAAMLIALGGKNPDEESIKKVLREAGAKADEANIKKFVSEIKGKDVQKLALEGLKKLGAGSAPAAVEALQSPYIYLFIFILYYSLCF